MSDDMRWGQDDEMTVWPDAAQESDGREQTGSSSGGPGGADGQTPPQYTHYQVHQEPENQQEPSGDPPHRKKKSFGKKVRTVIALGVIFGLAAGIVFQGVNLISERIFGGSSSQPEIGLTQTVPEADEEGVDTVSASDSSMETLVAQSGTVAGVAEAAMPSVVAITSVSIQEIPSFFGRGMAQYPTTGTGSGIIVGENEDELLIATNNHVVEGATTLSVCFIGDDVVNAEEETQSLAGNDGDINVEDAVNASIKGTDASNDLAVVSVEKSDIPDDTMNMIKIAQIGSSDDLVVGEQVVAIGNALGYGQSVTSGWISALDRNVTLENGSYAQLIQTDAAINPGNSGGALLNMKGELIGINSAKYASDTVEGMGYAIPISKAQPILENLMSGQNAGGSGRSEVVDEAEAAYMGVQLAELPDEAAQMYNVPAGAFIIDVVAGAPADMAGLQSGDIIVKLDGQQVSGREDLTDKLQYYAAGENVEVVVSRPMNGEYQEVTLQVALGARAAQE